MSESTYPIGKRYDGGSFELTAGDFRAFAAATDDEDPCCASTPAVATPMFHVRPVFDRLMMPMARDPELALDFLRLVHGEHAMRFLRPLREGDTLRLEGELLSADVKPTGLVVRFALRGSVDEQPALDGTTSYFIRAAAPPPRSGEARPAETAPPTPDHTVPQTATDDQATRYAAASGDHNPIHLDAETARAAGLPGVILHGLCTMAFAARDIARHFGGSEHLAEISVRFARPVFPGQHLTLQLWDEPSGVRFQTVGPDGRPVLSHGVARRRAKD